MEQKLRITPHVAIPTSEIQFRFSRSSGAGGQNVNKVSSRVELVFNVQESAALTEPQKALIASRLQSRINSSGVLSITSQESRSQWRNRELAVDHFVDLLSKALKKPQPRIATRATKASRERRLATKQNTSRKKASRRMRGME